MQIFIVQPVSLSWIIADLQIIHRQPRQTWIFVQYSNTKVQWVRTNIFNRWNKLQPSICNMYIHKIIEGCYFNFLINITLLTMARQSYSHHAGAIQQLRLSNKVVLMQSSGNYQKVIQESKGFYVAIDMQSVIKESNSHQTIVECHQTVNWQSSGSHYEIVKQTKTLGAVASYLSDSHQILICTICHFILI